MSQKSEAFRLVDLEIEADHGNVVAHARLPLAQRLPELWAAVAFHDTLHEVDKHDRQAVNDVIAHVCIRDT